MKWIALLTCLIPPVVAAATTDPLSFWMPLINMGGVGAVLAYTLWKLEPRMRGNEAAVDRHTRMLAIFLIEMPHIMKAAQIQSRNMIDELDHAKRLRNDPNEA